LILTLTRPCRPMVNVGAFRNVAFHGTMFPLCVMALVLIYFILHAIYLGPWSVNHLVMM